jgi:methionine biosynthesis protein MetW
MSTKAFEDSRWTTTPQRVVFRHVSALELITENEVLDIGCGDGLFLEMLTRAGKKGKGLDMSSVAVEKARAKGLQVELADMTRGQIPEPTTSSEVVSALDVLEHVYDPLPLLQEMARVSSKAVVLSVPNFSSLPARVQVLFGRVPENNTSHKGHVFWFTWENLNALAQKAGLRVVASRFNTVKENTPFIGSCMKALARLYPSLFALSFVVRLEPID